MISSPQNSKVKLVRGLLARGKLRQQEQKVVLEGLRLIRDVMAQGYLPHFVLHSPEADPSLLAELQAAQVEVMPVDPALFADLSETTNSQGLLAVCALPQRALAQGTSFLLALDQLRDPGNLGTSLRTAAAAGVDGVLLLPGTVDPFNPKALRAGMGAQFRLPLQALTWDTFSAHYSEGWQVWRSELDASATPYHRADFSAPTVLIIGNEAHGVSYQAQQFPARSVYIPMQAGVESLNAAAAAAVFLFEVQRQRGRL